MSEKTKLIKRLLAISETERNTWIIGEMSAFVVAMAKKIDELESRIKALESKVKWLEKDNGTLENRRQGFTAPEEANNE